MRVDGVKAPQHRGTPRSHDVLDPAPVHIIPPCWYLAPASGVGRVRVGHLYDFLALLFCEERGFRDVDLDVAIVSQLLVEVWQVPIWYGELVRFWNFAGRLEVSTPSFALYFNTLRRVLAFI